MISISVTASLSLAHPPSNGLYPCLSRLLSPLLCHCLIPSMSGNREPLFFDTALLVAARAGYALACRRFLLAALNPTLRELSTEESLPTLAHSPPGRPRLTPLDTYSDTDDDISRAGTPLQTPNASSMELSEMGEEPMVIKLNHGKSAARPVTKRATRGLSRAARCVHRSSRYAYVADFQDVVLSVLCRGVQSRDTSRTARS